MTAAAYMIDPPTFKEIMLKGAMLDAIILPLVNGYYGDPYRFKFQNM